MPDPSLRPTVDPNEDRPSKRDHLFGQLAVRLGFAEEGSVRVAFEQIKRDAPSSLGEFLVDSGLISSDDKQVLEYILDRGTADLLQSPNEPGATLSQTAGPDVETVVSHEDFSPTNPGTFGEYQIVDRIASGGMGMVYKARQTKLNRLVALKTILAGTFADEDAVKRFQAEAQAAAKLDHPNIVPVYEVGHFQGQHFYSMAFVEGRSLNDTVKADGPLEPRQAARLLRSVAEAVQSAHDSGIIHRDIKPHNILLDKGGVPRVTDFGLAKQVEADSQLTATGQIMGTPSFMAPEQAMGQLENIGPKSDVYSVGATLYFVLTGRPPFQAGTTAETIRAVIENEPVAPRRLTPSIPKDLETICLKCLDKSPDRRYVTSDDLGSDLDRFLGDQPIMARPVSRTRKAMLWCRRHPGIVGTALVACGILVTVIGLARWTQQAAASAAVERQREAEGIRMVQRLLDSETSRVDLAIEDLDEYRPWVLDDLKAAYENSPDESDAKLHAALALLPHDKRALSYLQKRLLTVTPEQFFQVRELVREKAPSFVPEYWKIVKDESDDNARRFQAACSLAAYDPTNDEWQDERFATFLVHHLVEVLPSHLKPWREALDPVKKHLIGPLIVVFKDKGASETKRDFATDTLNSYLANDPVRLFQLLVDADERQFNEIFKTLSGHPERAIELANKEVAKSLPNRGSEKSKDLRAQRQSKAAVLLYRLNRPDKLWSLLVHSIEPRTRSYIIHALAQLKADPHPLIERYENEPDLSVRRALLLSLGEFETGKIPKATRQQFVERLLKEYPNQADAGLHSATSWLLKKWKQGRSLSKIEKKLRCREEQVWDNADRQRNWYVNSQGQTFVILYADELHMGSPNSEPNRDIGEVRNRRKIKRRFAISSTEVTNDQWRAFEAAIKRPYLGNNLQLMKFMLTGDSPQVGVDWYDAAAYCNWLSETEGIPREQWCYEPNKEGKYTEGMKPKENYLELTGYRLPTEAEWEYACRSGAQTSRYYGHAPELVGKYGWFVDNSKQRTRPVGILKPNDYGMFDMFGNVYEWCHDRYRWSIEDQGKTFEDNGDYAVLNNDDSRVMRGGALYNQARDLRSASRRAQAKPDGRDVDVGFRPARTFFRE